MTEHFYWRKLGRQDAIRRRARKLSQEEGNRRIRAAQARGLTAKIRRGEVLSDEETQWLNAYEDEVRGR